MSSKFGFYVWSSLFFDRMRVRARVVSFHIFIFDILTFDILNSKKVQRIIFFVRPKFGEPFYFRHFSFRSFSFQHFFFRRKFGEPNISPPLLEITLRSWRLMFVYRNRPKLIVHSTHSQLTKSTELRISTVAIWPEKEGRICVCGKAWFFT